MHLTYSTLLKVTLSVAERVRAGIQNQVRNWIPDIFCG